MEGIQEKDNQSFDAAQKSVVRAVPQEGGVTEEWKGLQSRSTGSKGQIPPAAEIKKTYHPDRLRRPAKRRVIL